MNKQRYLHILFSLAILLSATACGPSLILQNVDYSQPVESVLVPNSEQIVHDQRFAIKFSIAPLLTEENLIEVDEIRMIRNRAGFYYVTASGFSNVYVFAPGEAILEMVEKVLITKNGLSQPAFNQRETYIELIDRNTGETFNLNY